MVNEFDASQVAGELEDELSQALENTLALISIDVYNQLISNIYKYVYENGNSSNIEYFDGRQAPTGQFLDAWRQTSFMDSLRGYVAEVYFDGASLKPIKASDGNQWNAHMSLSGRPFNDDGIADVLNRIEKSVGVYYTDKKRRGLYWDKTLVWLEKNIDKLFKKYMKKNGFEID